MQILHDYYNVNVTITLGLSIQFIFFCLAIDQSLQTILRSLARYADIQNIQDIQDIQYTRYTRIQYTNTITLHMLKPTITG